MILLASLLVAAAPVAAPANDPAPTAQAAAIQQQLDNWKGGVLKRDGQLACRTETSTGDPRLDAIRCSAMLACVQPIEGRLDTVMGSDAAPADKRKRFAALIDGITPCVTAHRNAAVAQLLATREQEPTTR